MIYLLAAPGGRAPEGGGRHPADPGRDGPVGRRRRRRHAVSLGPFESRPACPSWTSTTRQLVREVAGYGTDCRSRHRAGVRACVLRRASAGATPPGRADSRDPATAVGSAVSPRPRGGVGAVPPQPRSQCHPFVGRQPELAVLRAPLADARPAARRWSGSRGPPASARPRCSSTSSPNPVRERRPAVRAGQRRGDRGAARLRGRRSAGACGRAGRAARSPVGAARWTTRSPSGTRMLELLEGGRRRRPVVVVVDDVHWADQPSLHALVFALRRLVADPVLVLVALRDAVSRSSREPALGWSSGRRGTVLAAAGGSTRWTCPTSPAPRRPRLRPRRPRRLRYGTQGNPFMPARCSRSSCPSARDDGTGEDQPLPPPRSFRRLVQDRYAVCAAPAPRSGSSRPLPCWDPHCPLPQAAVAGPGSSKPLPALDEATAALTCYIEAAQVGNAVAAGLSASAGAAAVYEGHAPGPAAGSCTTAAAALITDEAIAPGLRHRVAAVDRGRRRPRRATSTAVRVTPRLPPSGLSESGRGAPRLTAARLSSDPRQAHRKVLRRPWSGWSSVATRRRPPTFASGDRRRTSGGTAAGPCARIPSRWRPTTRPPPRTSAGAARGAGAVRAWTQEEGRRSSPCMTAIDWFGLLNACGPPSTGASGGSRPPPLTPSSPLYAVGHELPGCTDSATPVGGTTRYGAAVVAEARPGDPIHRWMNPRSARGLMHPLVDDDIDAA